jgi:uncharacterized protein (UPF0303 family)
MVESARYSGGLESVINNLGGEEVLRLSYEADYQGYVDIDVLLNDGRVFSYRYYYGSCSGCDEWENRELTSEQIEEEMLQAATFFESVGEYNKWRETVE